MFFRQNNRFIELKTFFSIGSDSHNYIMISDPEVASQHARMRKYSNGFQIQSLKPEYKIWVNKKLVTQSFLKEGDIVTIGKTHFYFSEVRKKPLQSKNSQWQSQLDKLFDIAQSDLPVLITGPSGSGKDILACHIHETSPRCHQEIVPINCGAIHPNLVSSELFGHKKGSFTDAHSSRKGAFEVAHRSTLFLDEIGELPLSIQPQLLRVLENQQIKSLGSNEVITVNTRIIAATHQDLKQKVLKGEFREDLYYRLSVLQIQVPSLQERKEDLETFIFTFSRQMNVRFSFLAIEQLKKYNFRGNIRELKNLILRASVLFKNKTITEKDIPLLLDPLEENSSMTNYKELRVAEKQMLINSLVQNKGNQARTAYDLKIPRSTLYEKTKQYEIDVKSLKSKR